MVSRRIKNAARGEGRNPGRGPQSGEVSHLKFLDSLICAGGSKTPGEDPEAGQPRRIRELSGGVFSDRL
jgi:hypothetical protein